ncbi:MAG: hypothetical protein HZB82_02395 [Deltaproteobacteria bacterium]|nr:hypothetical protein [Deltaproteobacteria bacterium]
MKIPFSKIIKSMNGISTPYFGVQWNPPKGDREIAGMVVSFLEDQRSLYTPYDPEMPDYVDGSIMKMRMHLTDMLDSGSAPPEVAGHIRAMRASCAKFLGRLRPSGGLPGRLDNAEFFAALGEMRGVFGVHIAQLSIKYGLDMEQDLAAILPVPDTEED